MNEEKSYRILSAELSPIIRCCYQTHKRAKSGESSNHAVLYRSGISVIKTIYLTEEQQNIPFINSSFASYWRPSVTKSLYVGLRVYLFFPFRLSKL